MNAHHAEVHSAGKREQGKSDGVRGYEEIQSGDREAEEPGWEELFPVALGRTPFAGAGSFPSH